jgi:hypothetical protein
MTSTKFIPFISNADFLLGASLAAAAIAP